jgi:hypothetical protein
MLPNVHIDTLYRIRTELFDSRLPGSFIYSADSMSLCIQITVLQCSQTLESIYMASLRGFEPTDPFEPSVFKTAALSHAQPYFLNLVAEEGIEPPTSRL